MDLMSAVKTVLNNYANFNDRSGKGEFWWWTLAYFIGYAVLVFVGGVLNLGTILAGVFGLALLVPNIAVSVRRFHDIGKSGWWVLIFLIPLINIIAVIYFFVIVDSDGPNQYGEGPLPPAA